MARAPEMTFFGLAFSYSVTIGAERIGGAGSAWPQNDSLLRRHADSRIHPVVQQPDTTTKTTHTTNALQIRSIVSSFSVAALLGSVGSLTTLPFR